MKVFKRYWGVVLILIIAIVSSFLYSSHPKEQIQKKDYLANKTDADFKRYTTVPCLTILDQISTSTQKEQAQFYRDDYIACEQFLHNVRDIANDNY